MIGIYALYACKTNGVFNYIFTIFCAYGTSYRNKGLLDNLFKLLYVCISCTTLCIIMYLITSCFFYAILISIPEILDKSVTCIWQPMLLIHGIRYLAITKSTIIAICKPWLRKHLIGKKGSLIITVITDIILWFDSTNQNCHISIYKLKLNNSNTCS